MKRFIRLVGKMPFVGKFGVKTAIIDVVSSRTPTARFVSASFCLTYLAFFIFAHGFQAWLGVSLAMAPAGLFARVVGAVFAAVNLLVVMTQTCLFCRVVQFLIRRRGKYRRGGGDLQESLYGRGIFVIARGDAGRTDFVLVAGARNYSLKKLP